MARLLRCLVNTYFRLRWYFTTRGIPPDSPETSILAPPIIPDPSWIRDTYDLCRALGYYTEIAERIVEITGERPLLWEGYVIRLGLDFDWAREFAEEEIPLGLIRQRVRNSEMKQVAMFFERIAQLELEGNVELRVILDVTIRKIAFLYAHLFRRQRHFYPEDLDWWADSTRGFLIGPLTVTLDIWRTGVKKDLPLCQSYASRWSFLSRESANWEQKSQYSRRWPPSFLVADILHLLGGRKVFWAQHPWPMWIMPWEAKEEENTTETSASSRNRLARFLESPRTARDFLQFTVDAAEWDGGGHGMIWGT